MSSKSEPFEVLHDIQISVKQQKNLRYFTARKAETNNPVMWTTSLIPGNGLVWRERQANITFLTFSAGSDKVIEIEFIKNQGT